MTTLSRQELEQLVAYGPHAIWGDYAERHEKLLEVYKLALRSTDGVVVPAEPTEAMCKAGAPHCRSNSFTAMMVYKAMLAAAKGEKP